MPLRYFGFGSQHDQSVNFAFAGESVRPIKRVTLWNRTRGRAVSLAFGLGAKDLAGEWLRELRRKS